MDLPEPDSPTMHVTCPGEKHVFASFRSVRRARPVPTSSVTFSNSTPVGKPTPLSPILELDVADRLLDATSTEEAVPTD